MWPSTLVNPVIFTFHFTSIPYYFIQCIALGSKINFPSSLLFLLLAVLYFRFTQWSARGQILLVVVILGILFKVCLHASLQVYTDESENITYTVYILYVWQSRQLRVTNVNMWKLIYSRNWSQRERRKIWLGRISIESGTKVKKKRRGGIRGEI